MRIASSTGFGCFVVGGRVEREIERRLEGRLTRVRLLGGNGREVVCRGLTDTEVECDTQSSAILELPSH